MILGTEPRFRAVILVSAVILGLQTAWLVLPEWFRNAPGSPLDASQPINANRAAQLGGVRGDLWADATLTQDGVDWTSSGTFLRPFSPEVLERVRAGAKQALAYSPHDARLWLVLAAIDARLQTPSEQAAAALKMSYYTGPNELRLIPLRLLVAVRPGVLADSELQQLFLNELRVALNRNGELQQAIVGAYREADPAAKRLIDDIVPAEQHSNVPQVIRPADRIR
jgi:hypothetical protein